MRKRAFTLVELIVVIAVIGILAAIIAPNAFKAIEKSKIARAAEDIRAIRGASMGYYADTGSWPMLGIGDARRASGMGFLNDNDGNGNPVWGWNGPYLDKWPRNPWGSSASAYTNLYYWDADLSGDDNGNGITGEAQVIMFNVPRKSALTLDSSYDNGSLLGADVGNIYQNQVVSGASATIDPVTINWMIKEPVQ
ncbi:MAG: prepilin-type N-terminal cleavage/methylation domain-containing protein [Candidatus Omnitrophica bacterium]|nr:prepilin-type N-terminal cleavage/methylation domain-containing protein [Candidatus Omnitrophota bacterium]MDD5654744.1 prepilin-type N-terminal cleavage/methylation domain-containing protein [Candidatus Omnitrophota bacterium]